MKENELNSWQKKNNIFFLSFVIVIACNDIIPRDYITHYKLLRISFADERKDEEELAFALASSYV